MNELKGITGIDIAVNALVDELQSRKDELVSEISALAGIVTTDSNIQERKADRATVNKRRKEFDDERKSVERTWKNAIAPVSAAYKEAVAECDKVIADIDVGLKDFEEKRREAKKQLIIKARRTENLTEIKEVEEASTEEAATPVSKPEKPECSICFDAFPFGLPEEDKYIVSVDVVGSENFRALKELLTKAGYTFGVEVI